MESCGTGGSPDCPGPAIRFAPQEPAPVADRDTDVRRVMELLRSHTVRGLEWEYATWRPIGAWGNAHALFHRTSIYGMRFDLSRACVGSDVPEDWIALFVSSPTNCVLRNVDVRLREGDALWEDAVRLWETVHGRPGATEDWRTVERVLRYGLETENF